MKQRRRRGLLLLLLALTVLLIWLFDKARSPDQFESDRNEGPHASLPASSTTRGQQPASSAGPMLSAEKREPLARRFEPWEGFASISGRVLSESTRLGIPGAQIRIDRRRAGMVARQSEQGAIAEVLSGKDGQFLCENLQELDAITLFVSADGYKESFYALRLGQAELELGDLYLQEMGAKVRIRVHDVEGKPIPAVHVHPVPVARSSSTRGTSTYNILPDRTRLWVTNHQGLVAITTLEPGFHRFEIIGKEHVPLFSQIVEVPREGEIELSYQLEPGLPLKMRVENGQGVALAGVLLTVRWAENDWGFIRRTNADGIATFACLPLDGPLHLRVLSSFAGGKDVHWASHPRRVVRIVLEDDSRAMLRLQIEREPSGDKEQPALVLIAKLANGGAYVASRHRFKANSGTHVIPLRPGRYRVFALSGECYARSSFLSLRKDASSSCQLKLTEASTCEISTRVLSASLQPIRNARVRLFLPQHSTSWPGNKIPNSFKPLIAAGLGRSLGSYQAFRETRTDASGNARLHGLPGIPMRLYIGHLEHGHRIQSVPASLAGTKVTYEIILAETGSVHGQVKHDSALPVGTYVHLEDEAGILTLSTSVTEAGSYEFKGLPEGAYSLAARVGSRRSDRRLSERSSLVGARMSLHPSSANLTNLTAIQVRKGSRQRVDLELRDWINENSTMLRFEVTGVPASKRTILEAIPLAQDLDSIWGPMRHRMELSRDGTCTTRLAHGSYFVLVTQAGTPPSVLAWQKITVLASGSSKGRTVRMSVETSRLHITGLDHQAKGIQQLRLIPEIGTGSDLRRYSFVVPVSSTNEAVVEQVPHGLYRVEALLKGSKTPFMLPGSVRVFGRECTKRY